MVPQSFTWYSPKGSKEEQEIRNKKQETRKMNEMCANTLKKTELVIRRIKLTKWER